MNRRGPSATPSLRRRTFLQGTGAIIALPWLESLWPRAARAAAGAAPPTRLISYFVPLGMLEGSQENGYANLNNWVPTTTGANYTLSPALTPLAAFKNNFTVVSNTDATLQNQPDPTKAGHAKGVQLYCSAVRLAPSGTLGSGMSFDQVVAAAVGGATRLPSLQLTINDENAFSDEPFDPAYLQNISWSSATQPMPGLNSPTVAFNTLFPAGQVQGQNADRAVLTPRQRAAAPSVQRSILDASLAQTQSLQARLGTGDRQILDQFLTNLRSVEKTLLPDASGTTGGGTTTGDAGAAACDVPGAPATTASSDFVTRIAQYTQLMPLALACDQTRVISFMFARGESGRIYRNLGASAQHHAMSHYGSSDSGLSQAQNFAWLKKIQTYEMQCLAQLLGGLQAVSEGGGTLLDNTVVLVSSELSDTMNHRNTNMPVLVAGGGGGRLKACGQHIAAPAGTSFAQVLLTAIRATGVQANSFGAQGATASIEGML